MALTMKPEQLVLGPRPGKKSVKRIAELGLTHCCTLLGDREEPRRIEALCGAMGCAWIWLPIEGGGLDTLGALDLAGYLRALSAQISDTSEPLIYVHCSAGIHRTGFFAYVLLRAGGLAPGEALGALETLRPVTAAQVGDERIALAEEMLAALG